MSENYVESILARLEEIEKLQSKLRSLVPRATNYKSENVSPKPPAPSSNVHVTNNYKESKNSDVDSTKYPQKITKAQWQKLKKNPVKVLTRKLQDTNNRIQSLLSTNSKRDTVSVNTSVQTSESRFLNEHSKRPFIKRDQGVRFSSKNLPEKRRHSIRELFERVLEHFNYCLVDKNRVATPDHYLGDNAPRRVQQLFSSPNEEAETLKILSSAAKISIRDGT